jgi:hypothetical protein
MYYTINIVMIQQTSYIVDKKIIDEIALIESTGKLSINEPSGDFFYDPWIIKSEYRGTAIEQALKVLPKPLGEARLITLESGTCYFSHSDIDDRYHLNISGDCAALINLETKQSYFLEPDGVWYDMDAGPIHSAASYGQYNRKQIVVRKLLKRNKLTQPVSISIKASGVNSRFVFDNSISNWLNRANKNEIIDKFKINESTVYFEIEQQYLDEIKKIIPEQFEYEFR